MTDKNRSGGLFTDDDYIEALGLDPALKGTPAINKAIDDWVMKATERDYVNTGNMSAEKAMSMARKAIKS